MECNFSEPVAFDKWYFDELFGFNNIDVNRWLFADFWRNWTNGVLDITNTKFRHEAKIKNLDGLVFSVFFTHLYKLLNNKDWIKTAINWYISWYDSAIKILLQYFAENNIKYIYKEQHKFDNSFFKKFFNFGNKADNNLAFDQIGRKWLDDWSLDITNLNHKTNAKIPVLDDVGHVSFYTNIYRQLSDNGDIQVWKSWYIENKWAAKNTLKRYCKENGIICIDDGFRAEFDDKYFCDILNIANIYHFYIY